MTPEQQRIAIAIASKQFRDGWTRDGLLVGHRMWDGQVVPLPDYLNDRNAIHAAILTVFASNPGYYERRFAMMVSSVVYDDGERPFREYAPDGLRDVCACIMADTPKLAEALLRTIGKWVES
jgi:hypothetical protein